MWSWLHLMAWPSPFCVMPAERADHKTARVIAQFCSGSTRTELVECHRGGVRDVEARQGQPGRRVPVELGPWATKGRRVDWLWPGRGVATGGRARLNSNSRSGDRCFNRIA